MRLTRFMTYLQGQVQAAADPAVVSVVSFADDPGAFHKDKPVGLIVEFVTGAKVYVQAVRGAATGGDLGDERIIEGDAAPAPVALVPLDVSSGKVDIAQFEGWLAALSTNGGSREISRVRRFSQGEALSNTHRHGVGVDFHSGARISLLFVYTLPAGQSIRGDREYVTLDRI